MTPLRTLLLLTVGLFTGVAGAQQGGDLEAQIVYAFHTEDVNQLAALVQTWSTQELAGGADAARRYHLAHARYRLGLLTSDRRGPGAGESFAGCIDELKPLLQTDAASAEVEALQGACYASLAGLHKLERLLLQRRAAERFDSAFNIEPRNPRVLFLTAVDGLSRAKPGSPDAQLAYARLQTAVQLFETTSATTPDAPAWGHAEAYLEMGRQLEARGDVVGARNWIEKSLLVAPDYRAARRELAHLVRR